MNRIFNINRIGIGIGAIALVAGLLFSAVPASAASFAKYDGIDGESLSEDSRQQISEYNELVPQIKEHMEQLLTLADELRELGTASIISDKALPKLLEAAARGKAASSDSGEDDADSTQAREYEAASVKLQEAVAQLEEELARAKELNRQIAGATQPSSGASGQSRRRGEVILEDVTIFAQTNQQAAAIEEAVTIVGEIGTEFTAG